MTSLHQSSVISIEAEPQAQHASEVVAIRTLYHERSFYENYPAFQRGFVWPDKFKRAFIDSILRGFPVHPLLTYRAIDEEGKEKSWVLDGQQRLSTVYEFMNGLFMTWTDAECRNAEPSSLSPIEPGKRFNELTEHARNLFLKYKFTVNTLSDTDDVMLGMIFRRIQHQLPLTMAEKLASYKSKAIDYAMKLQKHNLWDEFYVGRDARKETLQGSLSMLVLEQARDYVAVNGRRLNEFASGLKDDRMTQELYDAVESRLEVVMHVFDGTTFTHRAEVIPMYQAVMLLEKQGYQFTSSDKGCLTSWYGQVLYEADRQGRHGFAYPLARLIDVNKQHDFWELHLPRLLEVCTESRRGVA